MASRHNVSRRRPAITLFGFCECINCNKTLAFRIPHKNHWHATTARLIAQSVVHMARALNLRVVAEGVETAWQRDYLVSIGCSELQGYLFSMPVPAEELARLAEACQHRRCPRWACRVQLASAHLPWAVASSSAPLGLRYTSNGSVQGCVLRVLKRRC